MRIIRTAQIAYYANRFEEGLGAVLLGSMTILNFGNVLSRYVFKASWSFTAELLMIMFEWSIFVGAAIGYKRLEHLGISYFSERFPVNLQVFTTILNGVISTCLLAVLVYSGYIMVEDQIIFEQKTAVLRWPEWVAGASVPVGGALIIARIIESTIKRIRELYGRS